MNPMQTQKKKMTAFNIVSIVLCLIFIPVIVINLTLVIHSYTNPDALPSAFGIKPAIVLSGSMEPTIQTGDLVFIHETDAAPQVGDVICYMTSEGSAVTHRVTQITTDSDGNVQYITQGDANNTEDSVPVSLGQIEGIWQGQRFGGVGNALLFMQTPVGIIVCLVCPLIVFVLWDIWRRRRLSKAEAARTAQLQAELEALKAGTHAEK